MTTEAPIDQRERRVLERALRDLGHEPADFNVSITMLPPNPRGQTLPGGSLPRRKEIVVTRAPGGETFRQEAYADGAWAGEVVQALISGLLGPQ
jgi:hypothetical protein